MPIGCRPSPRARAALFCGSAALLAAWAGDALAQSVPPAGQGPSTESAKNCASPAALQAGSFTWRRITVYGVVDIGVAYLTHGAPLSRFFPPGLPFMVQAFSTKPILSFAPNGLGPSKLGICGEEPFSKDVSGVFRLETGFEPTSLRLSNGPRSLIEADGKPPTQQATSGDSNRAGQLLQGQAYAGLSSKTLGTLTYGRQNSLIFDDLIKYDPRPESFAFSPLGYSGVAGGGGDTEDLRLDNVLKYVVNYGKGRLSWMHQFHDEGGVGGGADSVDLGGDAGDLSLDAVFIHRSQAVAAAPLDVAQNAVSPGTLAATISDNTAFVFMANYVRGPATLHAAYEHIDYADPKTPVAPGVTGLGGYVLGFVNNSAFAFRHKILQISWTGVTYAVTETLSVTGAYYRYDQNSYAADGCANSSAPSCSGSMNMFAGVADATLTDHFDLYGGVETSRVARGLSSGFLEKSTFATMMGVRFTF